MFGFVFMFVFMWCSYYPWRLRCRNQVSPFYGFLFLFLFFIFSFCLSSFFYLIPTFFLFFCFRFCFEEFPFYSPRSQRCYIINLVEQKFFWIVYSFFLPSIPGFCLFFLNSWQRLPLVSILNRLFLLFRW